MDAFERNLERTRSRMHTEIHSDSEWKRRFATTIRLCLETNNNQNEENLYSLLQMIVATSEATLSDVLYLIDQSSDSDKRILFNAFFKEYQTHAEYRNSKKSPNTHSAATKRQGGSLFSGDPHAPAVIALKSNPPVTNLSSSPFGTNKSTMDKRTNRIESQHTVNVEQSTHMDKHIPTQSTNTNTQLKEDESSKPPPFNGDFMVTVQLLSGGKYLVPASTQMRVSEFRANQMHVEGTDFEHFYLMYKGTKLTQLDSTLGEYGIDGGGITIRKFMEV